MRDILFKAKRIDNGEWVEGYYVYHIKRTICAFADCVKPEDEQHVIMQDGFSDWNMPRDTVNYDIDPNTLCQYTGLKDKNGKLVYEGDLLKLSIQGYVQDNLFVVEDLRSFFFLLDREDQYYAVDWVEIVGNVHENPELLK